MASPAATTLTGILCPIVTSRPSRARLTVLLYDSYGRTTETRCGDVVQTLVFNKKNHNIQSRSQCNGQLAKYIYDDLLMVGLYL